MPKDGKDYADIDARYALFFGWQGWHKLRVAQFLHTGWVRIAVGSWTLALSTKAIVESKASRIAEQIFVEAQRTVEEHIG